MRYYWAYGSNLCRASMRRRCPGARFVGRLDVQDARLVFRGVADVVVDKGSFVPGGLWSITPEDERELDHYEGVASRFYLKRYLRMNVGDRVRKILFYQMRMSTGVMPPSQAYLDVIARGYGDFGLPLEVLDAAVVASWGDKEVTPVLRARHDRKGRPTLAQPIFESLEEVVA